MIYKASIFDFDFVSSDSIGEAADLVVHYPAGNGGAKYATVITPNAYTLVQYNDRQYSGLKEFYSRSAFVFPDGMPVVWLSRLLKRGNLHRRTAGSDLFPVVWRKIMGESQPATLVLPNEDLASLFRQDYAHCTCLVPEFFDPTDDPYIRSFAERVVDAIIRNGARFVFLGLTFPKQELLGMRIAQLLAEKQYGQRVIILLLGASFEYYFGKKKRAPAFFRETGLEWLYRFALEPRRLWKRYTVDNVRFLRLVLKELRKR